MEKLLNEQFETLPLVAEGHSKIVKYIGDGRVITKLKPTVYSYTHNRAGEIPGTDDLRLRASRALFNVIRYSVDHAYEEFGDDYIVSKLVLPENTGALAQPFLPTDLTPDEIDRLPRATPIETVVKRYHTGTPKHRYFGMDGSRRRSGTTRGVGEKIETDKKYPELVVRFDWRNPIVDDEGNRLADEVLPDQMADWFIDTNKAKFTARLAFSALERHLSKVGLELWDICFFITEDGKMIFSEISPDCMRVKLNDKSLDKDLWRSGNSSNKVLEKWTQFVEMIEDKDILVR